MWKSEDSVDPSVPRQPTQHRLLLVDDEESILFAMRDYFTAHGYAVDCARDLREVTALLGRETYGVVVVDLCLNVTHDDHGLDVIEYVRDQSPSTRTLLLTAYGSPANVIEARRRGVYAVIHKPKPLSELERIVDGLISRER